MRSRTREQPRRLKQLKQKLVPRWLFAGAGVLVTAAVLAACGSSSHTTTPAVSPTQPTTAGASATVRVATVSGLGPVLVDSSGHTLYLLTADHQSMVSCTSSNGCTGVWPPLNLPAGTKAPTPGSGVQSSLLSTIKAPDGREQVTYNRWPLYTFVGDGGPGQVRGQGINSFGGVWWALTSAGQPASAHAGGAGAVTTAPCHHRVGHHRVGHHHGPHHEADHAHDQADHAHDQADHTHDRPAHHSAGHDQGAN